MYPDDLTRLRHMRDAAKEALDFANGKQRADLDKDRQLALALLKSIEIIGEASAAISAETTSRYPEIPWRQIRGMRNRLVHGYYEVDLNVVWDTVAHNLGPLLAVLEQIVPTGNFR
ncbi:MAG: DUF86 domain-containing protein [Planctomycetes bacterium]|nr:DUF86 domain-containing protein [Planctomycetota bacterium]MBU4399199.1 DUF86 domain-containing protein [Planctomycetota bacterium]MCG2684325.1 DUF86 domain-containing protein [Planctomycetales bacterium]